MLLHFGFKEFQKPSKGFTVLLIQLTFGLKVYEVSPLWHTSVGVIYKFEVEYSTK